MIRVKSTAEADALFGRAPKAAPEPVAAALAPAPPPEPVAPPAAPTVDVEARAALSSVTDNLLMVAELMMSQAKAVPPPAALQPPPGLDPVKPPAPPEPMEAQISRDKDGRMGSVTITQGTRQMVATVHRDGKGCIEKVTMAGATA